MSDVTAARLVEAMALQIGLHTGAKASDVQAAAKAALAALREAAVAKRLSIGRDYNSAAGDCVDARDWPAAEKANARQRGASECALRIRALPLPERGR